MEPPKGFKRVKNFSYNPPLERFPTAPDQELLYVGDWCEMPTWGKFILLLQDRMVPPIPVIFVFMGFSDGQTVVWPLDENWKLLWEQSHKD